MVNSGFTRTENTLKSGFSNTSKKGFSKNINQGISIRAYSINDNYNSRKRKQNQQYSQRGNVQLQNKIVSNYDNTALIGNKYDLMGGDSQNNNNNNRFIFNPENPFNPNNITDPHELGKYLINQYLTNFPDQSLTNYPASYRDFHVQDLNRGGDAMWVLMKALSSVKPVTVVDTSSNQDTSNQDISGSQMGAISRNELMKYDKLRELAIQTFATYTGYVEDASFSQLRASLTTNEISRLSSLLTSNTLESFTEQEITNFTNSDTSFSAYTLTEPGFKSYKKFLSSVLTNLQLIIRLENENSQLTTQNNELLTFRNILQDTTLLRAYIKDNYNDSNIVLMETQRQVTTSFTLKPEFKLYFERHGVPATGVFDIEKLNAIRTELGIEYQEYD